MLFHSIETKPTMLASESVKQIKTRISALMAWLVATIALVVLAIIAFRLGWSDGAKQILTIATTLAAGGGVGIFLGERNAAKEMLSRSGRRKKG